MDERQIEEILNGIYEGVYIPGKKLPEYIFIWNFENLISKVNSGYGQLIDFKRGTKKRVVAESFRTNINVFAGAKIDTEVRELSNFLWDGNKKRAKNEFIEKAIQINELYNSPKGGSYLRVEMDAALKQSMAAEQWGRVEETKEILPYLKYVTVGDAQVRDEHAAWDGLVYPVDHEFWNTHYPPNDWGCRCDVIQLRDAEVSSDKLATPNTSKLWANNPGKDQFIFDPKVHPYFENASRDRKKNNYGFGYE